MDVVSWFTGNIFSSVYKLHLNVAIPQSKILTHNCSCLKELQGQKHQRDWVKEGSVTGPTWDSSQGLGPRPDTITDAMVCLQTWRTLAWLFSEKPNKQLTGTDIDTYTQQMDWSQGILWLNQGKARSWGV